MPYQKNPVVKIFPHRNIYQYTCISPDGKIHNQTDHVLVDMRLHSILLDVRSVRGLTVVLITIWWFQKSGKRLTASKQAAQKFDGERFDPRKLNAPEVRKQYH